MPLNVSWDETMKPRPLLLLGLLCLYKMPKVLDHLRKVQREGVRGVRGVRRELKRIRNGPDEVERSVSLMTHSQRAGLRLACGEAAQRGCWGTTRGWVGAAAHTRVYD